MRRNLALGAAAILLFFGLAEVALRISRLVPTNQLRSPDLRTLDSIPGMFEPGQDFIDRVLPELAYRVRINSLGFRGAEFDRTKPSGTTRILCLGDSYTFGPYVTDEQAFPAQLGAALAQDRAGGSGAIEVVNGGVSGFTIQDELIFLRDKAFSIQPDVVVLGYCQNDVLDMGRREPMIETMRDHARLKSAFLLGPALKLLQRTAIFNGMQRSAAMIKIWRMRDLPLTSDSATPEQWEAYRRSLAKFVELVRQRGAKLLVVVWISADQISGKASMDPQARLAGYAREMGFEMLDLAPEILKLQDSGVSPYLVPIDGHPTAAGYATAARAAAQRLRAIGFVAAPAGP